jgi:chromosome segregation ATPase
MADETEREVAELRAQVARQQEELLRLRDQLIGRDAELGMAKGRVAELEDRVSRVTNTVAKIRIKLLAPFWPPPERRNGSDED